MRRLEHHVLMAALMWLVVGCASVPGPIAEGPAVGLPEVVPGQYIVTLAPAIVSGSSTEALDVAVMRVADDHGRVMGRALRLIHGFVATDLDEADVVALRADPRVATVEPDVVVTVQNAQSNASWNLDRIDQRFLPLDGTYAYGWTGAGVTAYIVDTGIRSTHAEFAGRVAPGYTGFDDGYGTEDCHSHGTHVAGILGGRTHGVAKDVRLVPVRVLDCSGAGTSSGVIAGLDWIADHRRGPAVVNLSMGGGASPALDTAVRNLVAHGVTVVVAAGNANADACGSSPARVGEALTIGATASGDARAPYSNFGTCVDLFAPGTGVPSAVTVSDASIGTKSGTSMAAPHAAGGAALVLQAMPNATPEQVARSLVDAATAGALSDVGAGSHNRLLYTDPSFAAPDPIDGSPPEELESPGEPTLDPVPEPTPEPGMPAGPPCSDCVAFAGVLAGPGDAMVFPTDATGSYVTDATGLHVGWLRGPADENLDLFLERRNRAGRWVPVARSVGASAIEEIRYAGRAGVYRWRVVARTGGGAFDLYLALP